VKQHLPPIQANLFCPILEMNRRLLGTTIWILYLTRSLKILG
jgi:hypothetical protein